MKVVDASAAVEVLAGGERGERVGRQLRGQKLVAPQLLPVEIASAIGRLVRAGEITREDADRAIGRSLRMPVRLIDHRLLMARSWQLRDQVRITDGFYVACAERLDCALVTTDGRLSRASLPGVSISYVQ